MPDFFQTVPPDGNQALEFVSQGLLRENKAVSRMSARTVNSQVGEGSKWTLNCYLLLREGNVMVCRE